MDPNDLTMLELFSEEARTRVKALGDGILALEKDPTNTATLDVLMRAAHALKGAARMLDLTGVEHLAHALEDVWVEARKDPARTSKLPFDQILVVIDKLAELAKQSAEHIPSWLDVHNAEMLALGKSLKDFTPIESVTAPVQQEVPSSAAAVSTGSSHPISAPEAHDSSIRVQSGALQGFVAQAARAKVALSSFDAWSHWLGDLKSHAQGALKFSSQLEEDIGFTQLPSFDGLRAELRLILQSIRNLDESLERLLGEQRIVTDDLYEGLLGTHMRAVDEILGGFPRLIRDLSKRLGKSIRWEVTGGHTLLDRDILAELEAPLTHLVRNACDHGLETPAERIAVGKPPEGKVHFNAQARLDQVLIAISDDGRGIDVSRVKNDVLAKGLVAPEHADKLTQSDWFGYLFLPGYSTAEAVTEISGRGVGLDAVKALAQSLGGQVIIRTQLGKGTTFELRLPISRALTRVLIFQVDGQSYAFPMHRLEAVRECKLEELRVEGSTISYQTDEDYIPWYPASRLLHPLSSYVPFEPRLGPILIFGGAERRYALSVDSLQDEQSVVIEPLCAQWGFLPGLAGTAILPDGSWVIVLDIDYAVQLLSATGGSVASMPPVWPGADLQTNQSHILLVEDVLSISESERLLLERAGYRVTVASDGQDGLEKLKIQEVDLIITDLDMPRLDGIDLLKRLGADPRLNKVPAIVVSSRDTPEEHAEAIAAGARRYLRKSEFNSIDLRELIEPLLSSARSNK